MICPECDKGMIPVLATKGQIHPYRETSILTHPQKYIKKVPCPRCNGSGIAYCCDGEDYNSECDPSTGLGDRSGAGEDRPMIA